VNIRAQGAVQCDLPHATAGEANFECGAAALIEEPESATASTSDSKSARGDLKLALAAKQGQVGA
jgi:hypothetical protein